MSKVFSFYEQHLGTCAFTVEANQLLQTQSANYEER